MNSGSTGESVEHPFFRRSSAKRLHRVEAVAVMGSRKAHSDHRDVVSDVNGFHRDETAAVMRVRVLAVVVVVLGKGGLACLGMTRRAG